MILGRFPLLNIDRTGIALLGAIALLATGIMTPHEAWEAVDVATIGLLFGLMVISAQFRLGGFYDRLTSRLAETPVAPPTLLAMIVVVVGVLSALLTNDVVCLAVAPLLIAGCARRRLDPVPYLLALCCAANVGSAATLIGNPQNMLIGQSLKLSFNDYLIDGGVPALLGLGAVWAVIAFFWRGRWQRETNIVEPKTARFATWQTIKGIIILTGVITAFVLTDWPRDVVTLTAAGLLLSSRKMSSREVIGEVDWHVLVLFIGLFVVNHAFEKSGDLELLFHSVKSLGIPLEDPVWLFVVTAPLSNIVSNVPAVMLLLPACRSELSGPILALSSTLAGNLFIVGSIANIIVVEQAGRMNIPITWRDHARVGIPVTLLTLAIAAGWLYLRATLFAS